MGRSDKLLLLKIGVVATAVGAGAMGISHLNHKASLEEHEVKCFAENGSEIFNAVSKGRPISDGAVWTFTNKDTDLSNRAPKTRCTLRQLK